MKKILLILFLLLSFAFVVIGYAAMTQDLSVQGSLHAAAPPKGIFIVDVEPVQPHGVTDAGSNYSSPTNLRSCVNATAGGSITYMITVENNSDATYWFRELVYLTDLEGTKNDLLGERNGITVTLKDKLTDSTATFDSEDWVPPHSTRVFYATYSFGSNAGGNPVITIVNFSFGGKISSYGDEILAILNNPDKYATLSGSFDQAYQKNGSTVLANVGADAALFDSLLGTDLKLDNKPVQILIERSNVDKKNTGDSYAGGGPTGCEYTIYVTTESLSGATTVYAISYTQDANGEWVQIGELYEGTTSLTTYTDSSGESYYAIDPDTWKAVKKTYTVFTYKGSSVTYKVNEQYGNAYQQQYKLGDIMSMVDVELFNQLDNHQILKDTYQILFVQHPNSDAAEILLLRNAYNNVLRYYEMRNSGSEFKLDSAATRAELLPAVEELARAMEYYQQVHDTNHS